MIWKQPTGSVTLQAGTTQQSQQQLQSIISTSNPKLRREKQNKFLMEQNNILMVTVDQLQVRTHYYVLIGF